MDVILAFTIGLLYSCGVYLVLRRSLVKVLVGLVILTNATNLLVFTAGGITREGPPLLVAGQSGPYENIADPLPQAFVLTAIVIGFGIQAFAMVLVWRAYRDRGTDDSDDMVRFDEDDIVEGHDVA